MPLASTTELLRRAQDLGYGQAAFNVLHLETLEGLIAGAEQAELPLILQISENCVRFHGSLKPLALATLAAARAAQVPVAVHLDHAENPQLVREAVDLGFSSVMYDGAALPYEDNLAQSRELVKYAHAHGVAVEAELGQVGGKEGQPVLSAHAKGARTDPQEAREFVSETGVDALAVAVGSSHAMTSRDAKLDYELIDALRGALGVPLVLHGSSGVSDTDLQRAIRHGMRKINVSTHLNKTFTGALRTYLEENPEVVDSRKYLGAARAALGNETARLLRVFHGPASEAAARE